jgi:hypothetical protein
MYDMEPEGNHQRQHQDLHTDVSPNAVDQHVAIFPVGDHAARVRESCHTLCTSKVTDLVRDDGMHCNQVPTAENTCSPMAAARDGAMEPPGHQV